MRIRFSSTIAVVAVAAVAIVGSAYAYASPSASPQVVQPKRNIAHVYTTTATGGTGQVLQTIPNPVPGIYAASFTANFFPAGTPAAPVTFSCYLTKDGSMLAQSTASSTYSSGFYVGVNGGNTVQVNNATVLQIGCGTANGSAWTYGTRTAQVTLTRLDGMTNGTISGAKRVGPAAAVAH